MNLFSEIKESFIIAVQAIMANKLRSVLAALGIIIGITAVTIMQTAIEGINQAFEKSIAAIGSDVLYVQKFEWFGKEDWTYYMNRKDITSTNYDYLKRNVQTATAIAPSAGTARSIKFGDLQLENVQVIGTSDEYQVTQGINMSEGRFFTKRESDGGYPVVVIGNDVKTALFPNISPMNQVIKVGTYSFKIIGVMEKQGSLLGMSFDNRVVIPIEKFFKIFGTKRSLTINVKVADVKNIEETKEEVSAVMRKARRIPIGGKDDFGINQQEAFKSTYEQLTSLIKIIGTLITGMSLIVGSIGIANIMFVTVKERTKEIGIRKAIGAKRRTILLQFLIESVTICLLGGVIGLIISIPISLAINIFLPTAIPIWIVLMSLIISVIFGVLSGFFPAWSAAKMDPVDSLRYE